MDALKLDESLFDSVICGDAGVDLDSLTEIVCGDAVVDLDSLIETFAKASTSLEAELGNCVVVSDSCAGTKAAKSRGMVCLGVATVEDKADLLRSSADAVYDDVSSIGLDEVKRVFHGSVQNRLKAAPLQLVQDWLQTPVQLPGQWGTDRRSILQVMNLGLATTCFYLLFSRSQALSLISPRSFLGALNPFGRNSLTSDSNGSRVEAFTRFIADVENKGGGRDVKGFPAGADWFNSPPLSLQRELRGKLIVLDFWTYCCINCMHVLPDLAYIEKRFAGEPVAVVGVHSAKFDNEKDSNAIRNAVLRYDVNHPVVNDKSMLMWRDLGVSSWPTLVVLSPKGKMLFTLTGEGHRQDLTDLLTAGLQYYGPRKLLDTRAIPLAPEKLKDDALLGSALRYPGKLASDLSGDRLFVSDSSNHRIVITSLSGNYIDQIGGNGAKLVDGPYEKCCFNRPQGVCYDASRDVLYVADTENHALREIDLKQKTVLTLAGNGYQGRDYKGGARGRQQQLSSPWDVELGPSGSEIFVAMAGQHQIWKHDIMTQVSEAFSGNGYERNRNGDSSRTTSWAQPSALSVMPTDRSSMLVADSESSSIRKLNVETAGSQGLVGGDPLFAENLFRFGDNDGKLSQVLLQHPLGVISFEDSVVLCPRSMTRLAVVRF